MENQLESGFLEKTGEASQNKEISARVSKMDFSKGSWVPDRVCRAGSDLKGCGEEKDERKRRIGV